MDGVYRAVVTGNRDPQLLGRVQVQVPEVSGADPSVWAARATLGAGRGHGTWFLPDPGEEVLVAFEAGDVRRAYVVGALWNATARPPDTAAGRDVKLIRSRSGATITFDETDGSLELADAHGNRITLGPSGISIRSPSRVSIKGAVVDLD